MSAFTNFKNVYLNSFQWRIFDTSVANQGVTFDTPSIPPGLCRHEETYKVVNVKCEELNRSADFSS